MKCQGIPTPNVCVFMCLFLPSPSSCMVRGCDTVKHCMISYCCRASGFSESTSSGGLLSMRQLKVWLFLRAGSCGHGTPLTGQKGEKTEFTMKSKLKFQGINTKERNTSPGSILEVTSGVFVLMSGSQFCLLLCDAIQNAANVFTLFQGLIGDCGYCHSHRWIENGSTNTEMRQQKQERRQLISNTILKLPYKNGFVIFYEERNTLNMLLRVTTWSTQLISKCWMQLN